jgi:acetylornithine deacetylase/succinyl-diaminopimelate desuccinylase-like protein
MPSIPRLLARVRLALLAPAVLAAVSAPAGQASRGDALMARPEIRSAIGFARANEGVVLDDQMRLCGIPAPPFKERPRAEAYRDAFVGVGLRNVRIDAEGNVIGERPGRQARPRIVLSAHLDTVFPEGTKVAATREGAVIRGPGIADDCRGLAVLLGVVRALGTIETNGSVTFVGTVGEEGLGDLRGVKHLFGQELAGQVDTFVSIDGAGASITHKAVGSRRYRVTFRGSGGHSFADFGVANPVHALGRAIAAIAAIDVPQDPRTTFNVGRIGGGTSVNAIAEEAWMEIDLRSSDPAALAELDGRVDAALDSALADENRRASGRGRLTVDKQLVGDRPAGGIPASAPVVRTAIDVSRVLGVAAHLAEGSTDANIPLSLGIPAITIDGGGTGSGAHTIEEAFDATDSWKGTARALLLTLALSE